MTFTLSQTPDSMNLYLYPDGFKPGTGTSGFTPSTGTNYECIDDTRNSANEDTDYVYTISNTNVNDLYTLPDHTDETGTINYVKVLARSRCTYSAQVSGSSYKLLMDVSGTTSWSVQKHPVANSYTDYTYTEASTPTGQSWTWDAVDDLCIGVEGNSQDYTGTVDIVLNPVSGTTLCQFSILGCQGNPYSGYENLLYDDESYLFHNATDTPPNVDGCSMWPLDDSALDSFTINSVTFFYRAKCEEGYLKWDSDFLIYRSGVSVAVDSRTLGYTYQTYTYEATVDPWTGVAWTWDNVNTIQAGIHFDCPEDVRGTASISRLYVVVNYSVDQGNELRTTQCYAQVNYTPATETVTLNQPRSLGVSHSRNISRHTFASGGYEVDDYGRTGKTLTLSGQETSSATASMQSLKDMVHYGTVVTVAGLGDTNLNTDYHIVDFSFSQEAGMVDRYMWNLSLEED